MTKLSTIIIYSVAVLSILTTTTVYSQTYTPPVKVNPINSILNESSGLQWVNTDNSLWTFNDSGGDPAIYRIDSATNAIFQTVSLGGATNVDWEDIAFDGTYLYVGDFGNNYDGARSDLKIYKFPYSAIPADYVNNPSVTIPASQIETINFSYSDQPLDATTLKPTPTTSPNTTKYDCEAMLVDNGQIHLFTKNWVDLTTTHYVINSLQSGVYVLSPLETLNTGYLVTAADKAPNTATVLLLGYQTTGLGNHFIHMLTGYSNGNYFNGNIRQINLPNALSMGQSEGITFKTDTYGYISNEKLTRTVFGFPITVNQMLHSFNTNAFPAQTVLPLQLLSFTATNTNNAVKIAWNFDTPVSQLQLQKSIDNTNNFITIKNFDTSKTDYYYDQPNNSDTYYRLIWSNGNGGFLYSNIVTLKSNVSNSINNFHLKQNGELNFNLNGNAANYMIQIIDVDGRIISKIAEKKYTIGINQLNINTNLITNGIVFITMFNSSQTISKKLFVE